MKKVFLLAVVVASIGFASCKKDYTCKCTTKDTQSGTEISASTTIHETKKKATDACEAGKMEAGTVSTTCEIQ